MIRLKPIARSRLDERVGDRAGLGDAGDAAARQVRRHVADVRRAVDGQVDDAHAVRADQRDPVLARDPRDLGLHRGGRLATLDHAAARDDHRRDAGRGGVAVTTAARSGLSATSAMSGRSGRASSDG